ncbi:hypothetical protein J4427_00050 [Candidatus Woesearchaeota archaeon]|nr:hypothetical protein [Candidatus Woesearchaeota archaeon]
MDKKADVWVSAVIYVGLVITILTIVLAAGLPVINRMRDKNTATETRDIMHELDSTIRDVIRDGPGAQRTPIIKISKGEFVINQDSVVWTLQNSKFMFSQSGEEVREGNLVVLTTNSPVEDQYVVQIALKIPTSVRLLPQIKTLSGQYSLLIKNNGVMTDTTDPLTPVKYTGIEINELTI